MARGMDSTSFIVLEMDGQQALIIRKWKLIARALDVCCPTTKGDCMIVI